MTICKEMYDGPDDDIPCESPRSDPAHKISIRKLLKFLCTVRTLEDESKKLKELLEMTGMSDSAFRRWRHYLDQDFGVKVLLERHHAHRRGAAATLHLQDFGIFDAEAFSVIAEAHRNNEPFLLDDTILDLGISTELYARFLWSLAFRIRREATMTELTQFLGVSVPTFSRYLRISRKVFLMDITQTQTELPVTGKGAYYVASWGLIDWKKLGIVRKQTPYESTMARLTQSDKPKVVLEKAPW